MGLGKASFGGQAALGLILSLFLPSGGAWAGVFTLPHFIQPEKSAIGIEPEFTLSNGAGLGLNLKYTRGITDINNAMFLIGTGGGPRRFRMGGAFTFDFFPDVAAQPGIGIALQGLFYKLSNRSQLELTATPYIHKIFRNDEHNEIEPYVAVPFGMAFHNGQYDGIATLSLGGIFNASETMKYVVELGININHSESYLSGGISIYP